MKRLVFSAFLAVWVAGPAFAADVTDEQKAAMEKAIAEKGCEGGKFFARGDTFIVDDTECKNGEYEITMDKNFKIIEMEEE